MLLTNLVSSIATLVITPQCLSSQPRNAPSMGQGHRI